MFGGNSTPSLADIAAVTDNNRNNGYNDMMGMGGMGAWWVLIILFALFGGLGNRGWGNGGNGNSCDNGGTTIVTVPTPSYGGFGGGWGAFDAAAMQRGFDNSGVIAKLDGISNGICSLGYDQLNQMNGLGNTVQQTGWNLNEAIRDGQVANMQSFNALQAIIQNCCCENRQGQAEIINAMDKNNCQTNWNMAQIGRDIMDNQNANYRSLEAAVRDGFCELKERSLVQENQALRQQLSDCNAQTIAQSAAQYVINQVHPTPVPSYDVPNPYCNCGSPWGNCGNNGCGTCR